MLPLEWLPQYSPFKFNILLLAPPLLFLPPPPLCYRPSFLSSFTSHPEARWRRRPGRWQTESCCRRMVCSCISGESSPFFLLPYNTELFPFYKGDSCDEGACGCGHLHYCAPSLRFFFFNQHPNLFCFLYCHPSLSLTFPFSETKI